jgi:hypothetical protein
MLKPIAKTIPPIWISKAGDNLIKKMRESLNNIDLGLWTVNSVKYRRKYTSLNI